MGSRLGTLTACLAAGLMLVASAMAAQGEDLRSSRGADLRTSVATQARRNEELRERADALRVEVDQLRGRSGQDAVPFEEMHQAEMRASVVPVTGEAVRVTLSDAPLEVDPVGVDDDDLIVHQQDIQAVVNALWAGGAEAVTIQGQRVVSTTGIKCVGNSVVLHGIPYAPPYVIEAIGPLDEMETSLNQSPAVAVYKQYVEAYGLGYAQQRVGQVEMAGYVGSLGISVAEPIG